MLDPITPGPHAPLRDRAIATTPYGVALTEVERAARDACRRALAGEGAIAVGELRLPVERYAAAAASAGHSPEDMLRRLKLMLRAYCVCHEAEGAQVISHAIDAFYRAPRGG